MGIRSRGEKPGLGPRGLWTAAGRPTIVGALMLVQIVALSVRSATVRFRYAFAVLVAFAGFAAAADWRIELTPDDALYPALDLSQAPRAAPDDAVEGPFGDGPGLLSVEVTATRDAQQASLTVDAPYLAQPARVEATLPRAGVRYRLRPALAWDAAALAALDRPRRETLTLYLSLDGEPAETRTYPAMMHPLDEALYYVRDGADHVDLAWIFAAYADPRDAAVAALIDAARARHPELAFDGRGQADAVFAQAFALWEAIEAHGVRYADEDPGLARGPRVWSQRVRLHGKVWHERRANCIDGSLLLAAAFERIGIRSVLLLVPRHALLGFYTTRDAAPAIVETTLLGARNLAPRPPPAFAAELGQTTSHAALASFDAALAAGAARYRREARGFGRRDPNYQWIDLATARAYGILPLAASSTPHAKVGTLP